MYAYLKIHTSVALLICQVELSLKSDEHTIFVMKNSFRIDGKELKKRWFHF